MSNVKPRTERGAAMQRALLDATIDCLVNRGVAGTTTAEISRRAGASPGLFVRYWPTKAAMLAAAAEHAEMRSLARFQSAWTFGSGGASRADRVTAAVHAIVEIYAVPEMRCIYELEAAALTDANLAAEILRVSASIDAFVVEAARRLAPGGPVEDSFDDMVRLVVDCARGVAQRTALETPSRAKTARRRTAELLAGLLVG